MSYEDAMIRDHYKWNDETKAYETVHQDLTKMPLSKLPIQKRLLRAIKEGRSFTNLESTAHTAIRWKEDYYIVSYRPLYSMDSILDIAVGRKGEVPFMVRSPYTGDPTEGKIDCFVWNEKTHIESIRTRDASPSECYSYHVNNSISTRLADLGIYTYRRKVCIKSVLNEKTHHMNKIYANVPTIDIYQELVDAYPIGMNSYEILHDIHSKHPDEPAPMPKNIPLLKFAWYFRNGSLALDSQDKTIKL